MSMDLQRFHATFFEESREGLDAMEAGATGWLVKPFNPEQLVATVQKVLG